MPVLRLLYCCSNDFCRFLSAGLLVIFLLSHSTASHAQSQDSVDLAQQMFVAYYGRPGDPGGMDYWAGQFDESSDLASILSAFGNSQEYSDSFGSLTNEQLVNGLFQQMFNRDADPGGLAFYIERLESGAATLASIAKQIADGAANEDLLSLDNKIAVAIVFTNRVSNDNLAYESADILAAQEIIGAVNSSADAVDVGEAATAQWAIDKAALDVGSSGTLVRLDLQYLPELDAAMQQVLDGDGLVGLAVGVSVGDTIQYLGGFGLANLASSIPVEPQSSSFRWASLSKGVTGTLAVILDTEGTLSLDDSVETLVNGYRVPQHVLPSGCADESCAVFLASADRRISLRQLLNHTGGAQHYSNGVASPVPSSSQTNNPSINTGIEWALSLWTGNPLVAVPGQAYSYSSFGFNLAGVALEQSTFQTFAELVENLIFTPLEMTTARPDRRWESIPDRVTGYQKSGDQLLVSSDDDVSWKLPGGGFTSTVEDLARFCSGLVGGGLIDSDSRDNTLWQGSSVNANYGLGFGVSGSATARRIFHTGAQAQTRTALLAYPDEGLCFVVMTNSEHANPSSIAARLESAWRGTDSSVEACTIDADISADEDQRTLVKLAVADLDSAIDEMERANYLPSEVDGFSVDGTPYFNLVGRRNLPDNPSLSLRQTEAQLLAMFEEQLGESRHLAKLDVHKENGELRYNTIWIDGVRDQELYLAVPSATYQSQLDSVLARGLSIRRVTTTYLSGDYLRGYIAERGFLSTEIRTGRDAAAFEDLFATAVDSGKVLEHIDMTTDDAGIPRFAAQFSWRDIGSWTFRYGLSCSQLKALSDSEAASGRPLRRLSGYDLNGAAAFGAIFSQY